MELVSYVLVLYYRTKQSYKSYDSKHAFVKITFAAYHKKILFSAIFS
jgi:hypothetical protein